MSALSGTVTSWTSTALSLQDVLLAESVPPGVDVVDASGVPVGGICVGTDKPAFVGGRVEVTKRGGVSVAVSCEILTHELSVRLAIRMKVQIFLWRCKDDHIISIIVEERISHTDINKGIADQI